MDVVSDDLEPVSVFRGPVAQKRAPCVTCGGKIKCLTAPAYDGNPPIANSAKALGCPAGSPMSCGRESSGWSEYQLLPQSKQSLSRLLIWMDPLLNNHPSQEINREFDEFG